MSGRVQPLVPQPPSGRTFRVGDEVRDLEPGGTWRIPPNVPHEVHTGPEGAVVIDVFAPVRSDWQALERLDAQPPLWP